MKFILQLTNADTGDFLELVYPDNVSAYQAADRLDLRSETLILWRVYPKLSEAE